MWFAGIDWADQHHDLVVMSATGEVQGHLQVAHNVEGVAQLVDFAQRLTPPCEQVVCVVETNQGLLVNALLEAGLVVCPINPVTLSRYRPLCGVKTDWMRRCWRGWGGRVGRRYPSCSRIVRSCRSSKSSPATCKDALRSKPGWSIN
jgi:hypothetical protein